MPPAKGVRDGRYFCVMPVRALSRPVRALSRPVRALSRCKVRLLPTRGHHQEGTGSVSKQFLLFDVFFF